jgi:hypothetical protein
MEFAERGGLAARLMMRSGKERITTTLQAMLD